MNSHLQRSATALVLLVCLSVAPVAAAGNRGGERDFNERVKRIVKKIQQMVGGITTLSDIPGPPKPG